MHRSYSSIVARSLHEGGIEMGTKFIPADWSNKEGHFEDAMIVHINKEILAAAGGDWRNPPAEKSIEKQIDSFRNKCMLAISNRKRSSDKLWGFKDPRTCLTWPVWKHFIDEPVFIVLRRPAIEVAESLRKRNNMPIKEGLLLYRIYNERINKILNEH